MKKEKMFFMLMVALLLCDASLLHAETAVNTAGESAAENALTETAADAVRPFQQTARSVQQELDESLTELSRLREQIAGEKIPLSQRLSTLEGELTKARLDYQKASRLLDSHTLDLTNLRNEIKARKDEAGYLSNLLGEYNRNFESRLHIAEIQRYREALESAKLAPENTNLTSREIYQAQTNLVVTSIDRLEDALGGSRFEGAAVAGNGLVKHGAFVLFGPAALFRSEDGKDIGTVEQRLGSLEPTVVRFANDGDTNATGKLVSESKGHFPLDPTLGNAHRIEATKESLWEHIRKGGPVMVPIFLMAGAALSVAVYKWMTLRSLRKPSPKQIGALLTAVGRHDEEAAVREASAIGGPIGHMLSLGIGYIRESRELIEEILYETVLSTKLKLNGMLSFIAISASSAPLLGLLGTVTGIMNTFKLITVFGSGDVKTLSSGISEALITTEFGLIVAIPSLLIHAFLSRKVRGVIDEMEKAAVSFVNQVSKHPYEPANRTVTSDA